MDTDYVKMPYLKQFWEGCLWQWMPSSQASKLSNKQLITRVQISEKGGKLNQTTEIVKRMPEINKIKARKTTEKVNKPKNYGLKR